MNRRHSRNTTGFALRLPGLIAAILAQAPAAAAQVADRGWPDDVEAITAALVRAAPGKPSHTGVAGGTLSAASSASIAVTSCADDGGFDTLRHAVLVAGVGDTVDLSGLACSKITLQSGAISTNLDNLTISGPGAGKLTIDGANGGQVLVHKGTGTLKIVDVTVAHGKNAADRAYGGCIYSKGQVALERAAVTDCLALGQSRALGAGILALNSVSLTGSTLSNNSAITLVGIADGSLQAAGGGVFAPYGVTIIKSLISGNKVSTVTGLSIGGGAVSSKLTLKYSTVTGNDAASAGDPENLGMGGGLFGSTDTVIFASTIDHNSADARGGVYLQDDYVSTANITQSTISTNTGRLGIGAIEVSGPVSLLNSTIAFNVSGPLVNPAVVFNGSAQLRNTIVTDNAPVDIYGAAITGDHNLIKIAAAYTTLPAGTISQAAKLQPLALNGGATRTHALGAGSPAINAAADVPALELDQRGATFLRDIGGAVDIGAFEVDTDHVFGSVFD